MSGMTAVAGTPGVPEQTGGRFGGLLFLAAVLACPIGVVLAFLARPVYRRLPWFLPPLLGVALVLGARAAYRAAGTTPHDAAYAYTTVEMALLRDALGGTRTAVAVAVEDARTAAHPASPSDAAGAFLTAFLPLLPASLLGLALRAQAAATPYVAAVWRESLLLGLALPALLDPLRRLRSRFLGSPQEALMGAPPGGKTGSGNDSLPQRPRDAGPQRPARREPGAQRWLVEEWLADAAYVGILCANGGVGKSALAMYLSMCVSGAQDFLGIATRHGPTLYVDGELHADVFWRRAYAMARGMGLARPPRDMHYYRLPGPLTEPWVQERLRRHVRSVAPWYRRWMVWSPARPVLVVFDSLTIAGGMGTALTDQQVTALMDEMERWGVPVLAVDHVTKPSPKADPRVVQPYGCYSADTQVLTRGGWKTHADWSDGEEIAVFDPETETFRWAIPSRLSVYHHQGNMLRFATRSTDVLVTANHRMLVQPAWKSPTTGARPERNTRWRFVEAGALTSESWYTPYANPFENTAADVTQIEVGGVAYPADHFLRFLGWWIAEGSLLSGHQVGLTQVEGPLAERMRETLTAMGIDYWWASKQWPSTAARGEQTLCHIRTRQARSLWEWLDRECGHRAPDKRLPRLVWSLSSRQQRIVLDAMIDGDGTRRSETYALYTTTSPRLADDTQRLVVELGQFGTISKRTFTNDRWNDVYTVSVGRSDRRSIVIQGLGRGSGSHKMAPTLVPYDGPIYCFTVPTGAYLTRRNGKIAVQGNSAFKWNKARAVWVLAPAQDDSPPGASHELVMRKNNFAPLAPSLGLAVVFTDNPPTQTYAPAGHGEPAVPGAGDVVAQAEAVAETAEALPAPAPSALGLVVALLRDAGEDGMTAREVADVLGIAAKTASNRLAALSKDGVAASYAGRWRLTGVAELPESPEAVAA